MSEHTIQHLAAALPLPDAAFEDFWQLYLRTRPALVAGATLELEREQLHTLLKLSFLAGRHATTSDFAHLVNKS